MGENRDRIEAMQKLLSMAQELKAKHPTAHSLRITFSGEGDEGSITGAEVLAGEDHAAEVIDEPIIDDDMDMALCQILPGGWEINEGSYGTIAVDLTASVIDRLAVSIEEEQRTTQSCSYTIAADGSLS